MKKKPVTVPPGVIVTIQHDASRAYPWRVKVSEPDRNILPHTRTVASKRQAVKAVREILAHIEARKDVEEYIYTAGDEVR